MLESVWYVTSPFLLAPLHPPSLALSHSLATNFPSTQLLLTPPPCTQPSSVFSSSQNTTETIVTDHRVDGVPTLVLANKQDDSGAMAVEEIKQMFNQLIVGKLNVSEGAVMPISALKGDGIREAVQWLFVRVQNARKEQEERR